MVRRIWHNLCKFRFNYYVNFVCIFWGMSRTSDKKSSTLSGRMATLAGKQFWKTQIFEKSVFILKNSEDFFCWNFEVGAVQKSVNIVNLVKSFHTSTRIYLQNRVRYSRERTSQSLEVIPTGPRKFGNFDPLRRSCIQIYCKVLRFEMRTQFSFEPTNYWILDTEFAPRE